MSNELDELKLEVQRMSREARERARILRVKNNLTYAREIERKAEGYAAVLSRITRMQRAKQSPNAQSKPPAESGSA